MTFLRIILRGTILFGQQTTLRTPLRKRKLNVTMKSLLTVLISPINRSHRCILMNISLMTMKKEKQMMLVNKIEKKT